MHSNYIRGGAALGTAALALTAFTACGSDSGDGADGEKNPQSQQRTPAQTIAAVTEKTQDAESAKISMTMSMPGEAGGDVEMSGAMGWAPLEMDVTMSGSAFTQDPSAPDKIQMVMVDEVMYMDMGEEGAKELDGKRWLKIDPKALAKESDDPQMADQLTQGLNQQNQDPSQQMALLLDSPNIKKVGEEKIDGVATEHYAGTVSLEEALDSNKSLKFLDKKDRKDLIDSMKDEGIEEYDVDVWVDEEDYPVQIKESFDSNEGPTDIEMKLTDYGTEVAAEAPAPGETTDLLDMLKDMEQQQT